MRTGEQLGHYSVGEMIGSGGMGEVYRATDQKLGRDVALKFLPEEFTNDHARLSRFEREAQLLAQLHHPNIASIFGLEESNGVRALAMELVAGPTLDERLEQRPMPLEESLSIAQQIAEAVEAAHAKGIIHRDLKPQNIKLTEEGIVKVLDFGLAKAMETSDPQSDSVTNSTESPTMTTAGTMQGMILGSAPYMSPEQAKGHAADERADVWSFGVVLYEMLSGQRLFTGDSVPDTLAGVLRSEIHFDKLPESTPAGIRQLLRRCLQRKRKQRLHHIADARLMIEDAIAGVDEVGAENSMAAATGTPRRSALWPVAVVIVAAITAALGYFMRPAVEIDAEPLHLTIQLEQSQQLIPSANSLLGFSPDGKTIYFSGLEEGRKFLFRRTLTDPIPTKIEGTDGADTLFVSPDGRWLGFVSGQQLSKVPVEGGRPFRLGDARGAGGATWLTDDTLIHAPLYSDGLFRMNSDGSDSERLTTPDHDSGVLGHWWPTPLPGETHVLFTAFKTPVDDSRIGMLDIGSGTIEWLIDGGYFARYIDTGHIIYAKGQRLFAIPFDAKRGKTLGPAVAVLDDVAVSQTGGSARYSISKEGALVFVTESTGNPPRELIWIDMEGNSEKAAKEPNQYLSVRLSPDQRRAAVTMTGTSRDLWIYNFDRDTLSRLTSSDDTEFDPIWTPDGRNLIYVVDQPPFTLFKIPVGQPDRGAPLFGATQEHDTTKPSLSPDGQFVSYSKSESGTGSNIYLRPVDGSGEEFPVASSRSEEDYSSFSPDGQFALFQADDTGRDEVYVQSIAEGGERLQISSNGGQEPHWGQNGDIFYRLDDEFFRIKTRLVNGKYQFEEPESMFRNSVIPGDAAELHTYDVTADGSRVIAVTIPRARWPRRIELITHWTDRLNELAPPQD